MAEEAPGPFRVFFPSLDGAVFDAPILAGCGRYPLVIFCHGHCNEPEHFKKWFELPATLARSGYVVAVPQLPQVGSGIHPSGANADLELLGELESWLRSSWEYRDLLQPGDATAMVGHSFGALLAARYALASSVSAYASLSGVWQDWPDNNAPIKSLRVPKLFTWGDPLFDSFTEINSSSWAALPRNKHRAVFQGAAHWDYLPAGRTTCAQLRGDCDLVGTLARELVAVFLGKYLPPEGWTHLTTCIPDSLVPPQQSLTHEQEFYAGSHLMGWRRLTESNACRVDLAWDTNSSTGALTKP